MTDRYQIPAHDVAPSDEMVEWLHENTEDWDGDPGGIVLHHADGTDETGVPGDWIVRDSNGRYSVEKGGSNET